MAPETLKDLLRDKETLQEAMQKVSDMELTLKAFDITKGDEREFTVELSQKDYALIRGKFPISSGYEHAIWKDNDEAIMPYGSHIAFAHVPSV
jgi:hypothetical protein